MFTNEFTNISLLQLRISNIFNIEIWNEISKDSFYLNIISQSTLIWSFRRNCFSKSDKYKIFIFHWKHLVDGGIKNVDDFLKKVEIFLSRQQLHVVEEMQFFDDYIKSVDINGYSHISTIKCYYITWYLLQITLKTFIRKPSICVASKSKL